MLVPEPVLAHTLRVRKSLRVISRSVSCLDLSFARVRIPSGLSHWLCIASGIDARGRGGGKTKGIGFLNVWRRFFFLLCFFLSSFDSSFRASCFSDLIYHLCPNRSPGPLAPPQCRGRLRPGEDGAQRLLRLESSGHSRGRALRRLPGLHAGETDLSRGEKRRETRVRP